MKYNPNIHNRRSIRLKGNDYSQAGLYFITICVKNRKCLFGKIENREIILNDAGKMVKNQLLILQQRFPNIKLHEYIVMPNHFHAILEIVGATLVVAQNNTVAQNIAVAQNDVVAQNINDNDNYQKGQPQGFAPTETTNKKTLGDMVGAFQSITTVNYIRGVKNNNWQTFDGKLWQRNYWEHIIRNQRSLQQISEYIINNPANWTDDKFHTS